MRLAETLNLHEKGNPSGSEFFRCLRGVMTSEMLELAAEQHSCAFTPEVMKKFMFLIVSSLSLSNLTFKLRFLLFGSSYDLEYIYFIFV